MTSPAHKIRIANIQATIWRNLSDKGVWCDLVEDDVCAAVDRHILHEQLEVGVIGFKRMDFTLRADELRE